MSHDEVPLPTNKRRRSIFDDHNNTRDEDKPSMMNFPILNTEMYYPIEYIEKVRTEIELWKMHITKTLEEKRKFKAEMLEFKNTVFDENILSSQQYDIIASFNLDEYMTRVKKFCDRAAIIAHQLQYKPENDIEERYLITQKKIEKHFGTKHSIDNIT